MRHMGPVHDHQRQGLRRLWAKEVLRPWRRLSRCDGKVVPRGQGVVQAQNPFPIGQGSPGAPLRRADVPNLY
jgi:hypothetical protein